MRFLVEYRNKWGDRVNEAIIADGPALAFAAADVAAAPPNTLLGVYQPVERPETAGGDLLADFSLPLDVLDGPAKNGR